MQQIFVSYNIYSAKTLQNYANPLMHLLYLSDEITLLSYVYSILLLKGCWESNINVLFGISFTLKPNKKLRINCFHLL